MSPEDIVLVQESWKAVVPIQAQAAGLFYGRLFEIDPDLKALFKGDINAQGVKLMGMLNTVIAGLTRLDTILPAAQALAVRHVGYGVKPQDYETVGAALIWTLQQGLGPAFTPELQGAWTRTYGALSGVMIAAAK
jgi:nitric oxide dioxygenase